VSECIHCGFCLSSCPTYEATRRERSGPRGRIALMGQPEGPALREELDFCLGCLACTSACPAGVDFGALLETARVKTAPRWRRRLLRLAFGGPRRMRLLRPWPKARIDEVERPEGKPRLRAGLLTGCVQDQWFRRVNRDTADVLLRHGCEVVTPRLQGCCGALHGHQGDPDFGRALAERLRARFDADVLVSNAAGCGAHLKRLGFPVKEVHELVCELGLREAEAGPPLKVAYKDACHLSHGQGIREAPRALLRAIPGVEVVDLEGDCCGAAGIYFLLRPRFARSLRADVLARMEASSADVLAVANPGCMIQLRGAVHPVSLYVNPTLRASCARRRPRR